MIEAEIKALIQKELPRAIAEEPGVRDFVLRTVSEYYTPRTEFDEKFDRVLNEYSWTRKSKLVSGMSKIVSSMLFKPSKLRSGMSKIANSMLFKLSKLRSGMSKIMPWMSKS
ncbi:hypothetical protein U9R62_13760 [Cylindrospermopsis raciborskii DSH]|uniref:hypothetical protein n=1 Tax=Cylindrospermopsis raciborskii TaxID=77022 RepID=UPI002ED94133